MVGTEVFGRVHESVITSVTYIKLHRDLGIYHNQNCFVSLRQSTLLHRGDRGSEADPLIADVELRIYVLQEDVAENPEGYS